MFYQWMAMDCGAPGCSALSISPCILLEDRHVLAAPLKRFLGKSLGLPRQI